MDKLRLSETRNSRTHTHAPLQGHWKIEEDAPGHEERAVGGVRGAGGREGLRRRQDSLRIEVSCHDASLLQYACWTRA